MDVEILYIRIGFVIKNILFLMLNINSFFLYLMVGEIIEFVKFVIGMMDFVLVKVLILLYILRFVRKVLRKIIVMDVRI